MVEINVKLNMEEAESALASISPYSLWKKTAASIRGEIGDEAFFSNERFLASVFKRGTSTDASEVFDSDCGRSAIRAILANPRASEDPRDPNEILFFLTSLSERRAEEWIDVKAKLTKILLEGRGEGLERGFAFAAGSQTAFWKFKRIIEQSGGSVLDLNRDILSKTTADGSSLAHLAFRSSLREEEERRAISEGNMRATNAQGKTPIQSWIADLDFEGDGLRQAFIMLEEADWDGSESELMETLKKAIRTLDGEFSKKIRKCAGWANS